MDGGRTDKSQNADGANDSERDTLLLKLRKGLKSGSAGKLDRQELKAIREEARARRKQKTA